MPVVRLVRPMGLRRVVGLVLVVVRLVVVRVLMRVVAVALVVDRMPIVVLEPVSASGRMGVGGLVPMGCADLDTGCFHAPETG